MNEEELEEIEDSLLREDNKKQKKPMPVSGKGIFILKKIIDKQRIKSNSKQNKRQ